MMRSGNPVLKSDTFSAGALQGDVMTIGGTVQKTFLLLAFLVTSAGWVWNKVSLGQVENLPLYLKVGAIGGFIVMLILIFNKKSAWFTAPLYAVLQGLVLGGLSALFEKAYPGIVIQAVGLTFGTLAALLFAYQSKLIRATENFKLGVFAATGGIMILYLIDFGLMIFLKKSIPLIHENGMVGILFSLFVVAIAAFNLVLDFDFIERGAEQGAPKYMEWYGAFGLMVTLIWLYIELLRLLSKTRKGAR